MKIKNDVTKFQRDYELGIKHELYGIKHGLGVI